MTAPVAVIIPIYNTEATLPRCIDSVLAQTMPASEIILVDDGSPDGAGAIADDYASRYDQIKVIHKKNAGLAEARRTGINSTTQPLIMHLDSDDTLPPDSIEFLHGKLTEHNLDIAYGCYLRIPDRGKPFVTNHVREGLMTGDEFIDLNMSLIAINTSWSNISRRELWTPDVFPPANGRVPSEDVLINVNLGFNIKRAGQWNHPTYCYYYNPGSLSVGGSLCQLDKWKQHFNALELSLKQHGVLDRYSRELHMLKIHRLAFIIKDVNTNDPWVKAVLNDHSHAPLDRKTRVLQRLLHTPRLLKALVTLNRLAKYYLK